MEKGSVLVLSKKVDEISQSEEPQTFSNFSSLIGEYLDYFWLIVMLVL